MKHTKRFLLILLCAFLVTGCGVKLENGEEAIVSFKDGDGISAQEYYDLLKDKYGVVDLIDLIDTKLLENEYDVTDEEKSYINQIVSSIKSEAGDSYLEYIQYYYGVSSEKDFEEYIRLNYRRNEWIQDYAESKVSEKAINEYYEKEVIGDITASHILIMPETTSDMTDDQIKEAEKEALNTAKDIIKKLKNGEDFASLAKKYSDDTANASDGGKLEAFNNFSNFDANFLEAAIELEVGKYSSTPVKSTYGYHIIYKTAEADKPKLDDVKDKIITAVANTNIETDANMYLTALEALREKYEMNIVDTKLSGSYETYLNSLTAGNTETE